jgi:hypothetical protein
MMKAAFSSETSAYSNETTLRYIPEGSNIHTGRREILNLTVINQFNLIYVLYITVALYFSAYS